MLKVAFPLEEIRRYILLRFYWERTRVNTPQTPQTLSLYCMEVRFSKIHTFPACLPDHIMGYKCIICRVPWWLVYTRFWYVQPCGIPWEYYIFTLLLHYANFFHIFYMVKQVNRARYSPPPFRPKLLELTENLF